MRAAEFCEEFFMRFGAREGGGKFILKFLRSFARRDVFFQRSISDVSAEF